MARLVACAVLMLALVSTLASGAVAGGPEKSNSPNVFRTTLVCDSESFDIVVVGNGNWTVAHVVDSNLVFHPTAFPSFVGVLRDPQGNIIEEVSDPPSEKKNVPNNNKAPILSCSYNVSFTFPDGSTISGTGTAEGYFTPFRR